MTKFTNAVSVRLSSGVVILGVAFTLYKIFPRFTKPVPPGPRGWPLVGYISILSPDMYLKFKQLGAQYGNLFSFYLGSRLTVVLNDYQAIRLAFVDQSVTFAGRPYPWVLRSVDVVEEINNGTYTEEWVQHTKFVRKAMRQFGYGSGSGLDGKVEQEIQALIEVYMVQGERPLDPRKHLSRATANLIFSILGGSEDGESRGEESRQIRGKGEGEKSEENARGGGDEKKKSGKEESGCGESVGGVNERGTEDGDNWKEESEGDTEGNSHRGQLHNSNPNTTNNNNTDPLSHKLEIISRWQSAVGEANIIDLFPILRLLPFGPLRRLRKVAKEMKEMYTRDVEALRHSYQPGRERHVIDMFFKEKGLDYDAQRLAGLFVGFAGDATDSLPEAMAWMVLYLTHHPHIQANIQQEVDMIGGPVSLGHRSQLPYTEAFVLEGLRVSSFVPISEPHTTLTATTLAGYHIPVDSLVLANLYAAHMDEEYWGDPGNFRPERFLDEEGRLKRQEAFMGFSVGRRSCIGEQLSMKVLVLYVASLLQHFSLHFPLGAATPGLTPPQGYNRRAPPFSVVMDPR